MKLNNFIWNNYKQTPQGKETIDIFANRDSMQILSKFAPSLPVTIDTASGFIDDLLQFCTSPKFSDTLSMEEAAELYNEIVQKGFTITYPDGEIDKYDSKNYNISQMLSLISTWLYLVYPDFFKPYFFTNNFTLLIRIADNFGLDLPAVPLKRYKDQRHLYYNQLCETFADFQFDNDLTAPEMCAFLYDFAPNYLSQTQEHQELPQATQIWWIGGDKGGGDFDFLDSAKPDGTSFWQGSVDTKRGDILVMYCLSPRSYIHSIWRATADGIADPFFYYYSSIYIGHPQKVTPISIKELKTDIYFSKNPLVRKNLQGINGYPMSSEDYAKLQQLIQKKGGSLLELPQLYSHIFEQNKDLQNERDVETHLIEPLLKKIGYAEKDWVRQLSVRMGRGERNYPDYTFLSDKTPGYEKAFMLIESKFWIKNNLELEDTFKQAWSYGQRLSANTVVIADKEAIWIYLSKRDSFDRTDYTKLFWKELEEPDKFNQAKKLIGK